MLASHATLTPAAFLALLQGAQEALYFGAELDSEIASDDLESRLVAHRLRPEVDSRTDSVNQLGSFNNMVLGEARAIREAVNAGKVTFHEVLLLTEKAERFRKWLAEQPPSTDLLQEFYAKTIEKTWAERLPTKSTRWATFTGAGLVIDALADLRAKVRLWQMGHLLPTNEQDQYLVLRRIQFARDAGVAANG